MVLYKIIEWFYIEVFDGFTKTILPGGPRG